MTRGPEGIRSEVRLQEKHHKNQSQYAKKKIFFKSSNAAEKQPEAISLVFRQKQTKATQRD